MAIKESSHPREPKNPNRFPKCRKLKKGERPKSLENNLVKEEKAKPIAEMGLKNLSVTLHTKTKLMVLSFLGKGGSFPNQNRMSHFHN